MPGMHGMAWANYALMESDLILAVVMRFDDRVTGKLSTFAPKAKVIHIDIDPAEISKNVPADIPIVGDAKTVLRQLIGMIKKLKEEEPSPDLAPWHAKIKEWKLRHPLTYKRNEILRPQYVVEQVYDVLKGRKAIVTTGVGQNQMWAAQYYNLGKPRTFLSSGGLGTMGFGLPAAIGAQFAHPDAVVVDIDGDGSLQMVSQDIATAVINKLPINVAILNNGYLGMVRQWQSIFFGGRYSGVDLQPCAAPAKPSKRSKASEGEGFHSPDFVKLAEAYGAKGIRVKTPEEVRPALEEAIASPLPVLIDFWVCREENVFPMVPAGTAINQMLGVEG